jgi:hypothetical protein
MGEPVRISERDIRALLRIVTGDREDDPADGLPWSLLADLSDQIASDTLSFAGLDSQRQTGWFARACPPTAPTPTSGRSGPTTGIASRARTPTAPATCAA